MSDSLREHLLIASKFLRNPRTVGAVSASSKAMAREMVAPIPRDTPVNVVELGPGTGSFTRAILERIAPGSRVMAIEVEAEFVERLRPRWPSVEFVLASAVELEHLVRARGMQPVYHIVSGLPFASMLVEYSSRIMDGILHTLRPGGTFTTFQYVHGYRLPSAVTFRRHMSVKMGHRPHVRLVLKNLLPALVLTWTKT